MVALNYQQHPIEVVRPRSRGVAPTVKKPQAGSTDLMEEEGSFSPVYARLELSSASCRSVNSPKSKRRKMASSSHPPISSAPAVAQWPYEYERTFVAFMYEEVTRGMLVGNKFSDQQWIDLACKMRTRYPESPYTVHQLKGKFDRLKSRWKKYHRLLTTATGFAWDEATGTVTASNETWAYWIQNNLTDRALRHKGLPLYNELTAIFAPTTATGNMARSSAQTRGRAPAFDDDGGTPRTNLDGHPGDTTPSPTLSRRRVVSPSSSNRRRKSQDGGMSSFMESYVEANKHIKKAVVDDVDSDEDGAGVAESFHGLNFGDQVIPPCAWLPLINGVDPRVILQRGAEFFMHYYMGGISYK